MEFKEVIDELVRLLELGFSPDKKSSHPEDSAKSRQDLESFLKRPSSLVIRALVAIMANFKPQVLR